MSQFDEALWADKSVAEDMDEWLRNDFAAPSPRRVKCAVLQRNAAPKTVWVETGTFYGQTTQFLSTITPNLVFSIEPSPELSQKSAIKLAHIENIKIVNGTSEQVLPLLLPKITGNVSFWLDGHYSGGPTFPGPNDTPIVQELECISAHLKAFGATAILIDDIRLFTGRVHAYGAYPTLDYLVDWARSNGLHWHIEQDIFVARNFA